MVLKRIFGRGAAQGVAQGVRTNPLVNLSELQGMVKQGVNPDVAAKILATTGTGSAAAAAAAPGGGYSITKDVIGNLIASGALTGLGSFLGSGSGNPLQTQAGGKGYIFGPQNALAYQQYSTSPYIIALSRLGLIDVPSLAEFRRQQIQDVDIQMERANERKIRENLASLQAEGQIRGMEAAARLQGTKLEQEGALGVQELASLGDVQKQRVQSGYEAASNMLQKAIENIAYVEKMGGDNVAQQLGTLSNI